MQPYRATTEQDAATIYCTRCGRPMRIAPEHMHGSVACPHCSARIEPARAHGRAYEAATVPYSPSPPPDPAQAQAHATPYAEYSSRNRWIAGALAILLGYFGVHRFYMGHIGIGLAQVMITVCSFGVLYPVVHIWAFIEGVLCFVGAMSDVDGRPLSG